MKISSAALVVVCALSAPFVAGCEEDACEPGFERVEGVCVDARLRFVGSWVVTETCSQSGTAEYMVSVAVDPDVADGLRISNFWNLFNAPVTATLSTDAIEVARQEPDGDNYFVQGSGTVQDEPGSLSLDYIVSDENDTSSILTDVCDSTWTQQ